MLHPAIARALATARVEDQLRAAGRWRAIGRARRVARESPEAAASTAGQRSTSTPTHVHAARPAPRHETNRGSSSSRMTMAIQSSTSARSPQRGSIGHRVIRRYLARGCRTVLPRLVLLF